MARIAGSWDPVNTPHEPATPSIERIRFNAHAGPGCRGFWPMVDTVVFCVIASPMA